MKASKRREIEAKASALLQRNRITKAPIDVEDIASKLGITVRRTPTDDDISGFLLRQPDGQSIIGVNTLHHPNRQRFTIAHEIGHFQLHEHGELHVDRAVVRLRSEISSRGENEEEIEANFFAAELLMPRGFLKRDVEELTLTDWLDDRKMPQLAKKYGVSVQALTNRLITLGYGSRETLGID